ncbi:MAG: helicase RepA family protein [Paracoccaceae bacterium]
MPLDRIEDWDKILKPLQLQSVEPVQILDRSKASKAAMEGDHWNNNILRLVASWLAKGNTEEEIHILAQAHTLPGYTNEKTREDVQKMIDGAKNKGFAPNGVKKLRKPLLEHIANIELAAPQYLVEGLIEQQSLCQIFGVSGSGKSFLAIDMACSIGSGKDFHGRPVIRGPVVYVAGEARKGVIRRINAWAMAHSIKLIDMSLYVSRTAVGINNENNLSELKAEMQSIEEEFGSPALIILDTLARNFGDGDENDTRDMTSFISEVDRLNDEFDCASLIVHHAGHGEKGRARGSSALKGALDAEYKIFRQDDRITMSCTKMKDEEEPEPMCFYLVPIELGQSEKGTIVSSAVLEFRGTATPESARLTKNEWFAVETFREAAGNLNASPLDLNPAQLHLDQWREVFNKRATQDNPDSKRKAFDRARKALHHKAWLTVDNDMYTLTPRTPGQSPDKQD